MARPLYIHEEHVKRLLRIAIELSRQPATADGLSRRFRISRRTVFRELSELGKIGIEITMDEEGYRATGSPETMRRIMQRYYRESFDRFLARVFDRR